MANKFETEKALVKVVQTFFENAEQARKPYEEDWYLNIAYLNGQQYSTYIASFDKLYTPPKPAHRVRITCNKILPAVRTLVSKFLKMRVDMKAIPEEGSPNAREAAKTGNKVLLSISQQENHEENKIELAYWTVTTGNGFLGPYFNPNIGRAFEVPKKDETGNPVIGENGLPIMETIQEGVVETNVYSPFQIYPEPRVTSLSKMRKLIITRVMEVNEVFEQYGIEIKPEDIKLSTTEEQLNQSLGRQSKNIKNSVIVKEYREKPTKDTPLGMTIIIARDKVLYQGPLPPGLREYGELGLYHFPYIKKPGCFWAEGAPTQARPLQREYNRSRSQIIEHKNMFKGKLLIPTTCMVSKKAFTNEPGEKIYYNPSGGKPEHLSIKPLGNELPMNINMVRVDMEDVLATHEASQGAVPRGVKSGAGLTRLIEMDESQLTPSLLSWQISYTRYYSAILKIIAKTYLEKRTLVYFDNNSNPHVIKDFLGEMLSGCTNVKVSLGASLPLSLQARKDFLMTLWEGGVIQDPEEFLKLIDLGDVAGATRELRLDETYANWENGNILRGVELHAKWYENHSIHVKVHNDERKRPGWDSKDPLIIKLMDTHIREHLQIQSDLQNLEAEKQDVEAERAADLEAKSKGRKDEKKKT